MFVLYILKSIISLIFFHLENNFSKKFKIGKFNYFIDEEVVQNIQPKQMDDIIKVSHIKIETFDNVK